MYLCGQDLRRGLQFVSVYVSVCIRNIVYTLYQGTRESLYKQMFSANCAHVCVYVRVVFEQVAACMRRCQKLNMLLCDVQTVHVACSCVCVCVFLLILFGVFCDCGPFFSFDALSVTTVNKGVFTCVSAPVNVSLKCL